MLTEFILSRFQHPVNRAFLRVVFADGASSQSRK
jgi:hypothetical protein